MKVNLSNVTLAIADCKEYGKSIQSIKATLREVTPEKTIFFTDIKASNPQFNFDFVPIPKIKSKEEYSRFIMKELYKHIETDYVLIIQHDTEIFDGNLWLDEFYNYDYIGAVWPGEKYSVGNGGLSFRSKRLMEILGTDPFITATHPEDMQICRAYREYLEEKYDIKFAPEEVAHKFSYELGEPVCPSFGRHGTFHEPYKPTVVVRRSAAGGDIVAVEPVLDYYHKKGYNVYIDCPPIFYMLYVQHHFPVKHFSLIDGRIPYELVDLDMSYENNPKQLHLKSYYEAAGITDGEIKNPKLNFKIGEYNRLFKKYVVLHIDQREQMSRNIYGVDWQWFLDPVVKAGYDIIAIGQSDPEINGVLWMNTLVTPNMAMYVIAGASAFIGVDSMPSNIAVALNVPAMIFSGSVDLRYIYPDMSKVIWAKNDHQNIAGCTPFCWHKKIGSTTGSECTAIEEGEIPPCVSFFASEQRMNLFRLIDMIPNYDYTDTEII